jgi:hypothetical protein
MLRQNLTTVGSDTPAEFATSAIAASTARAAFARIHSPTRRSDFDRLSRWRSILLFIECGIWLEKLSKSCGNVVKLHHNFTLIQYNSGIIPDNVV